MLNHSADRGLAQRMADCTMAREGLLDKTWSYDYGVVWRGMEMLYAQTGKEQYYIYIRDAMDTFVDQNGGIRDYDFDAFNLDYLCNGRQLLFLYKKTGCEQYRKAADILRGQLALQPRTTDGGFWHKKCYPHQMWLDGLHMAAPFYLEYALMAGEGQSAIDDVAKQLTLAYTHTLDEKSGLNRHAWDEARAQKWAHPKTGKAAHAWGRAMGWYLVALIDVLDLLPQDNRVFPGLLSIFQRMSKKLLSVREDGVWMQVLDCPNRQGNYAESSASCLIDYALLKGARLGYLSGDEGCMAKDAFKAIVRHFVWEMADGRMFLNKCCTCAGLGGSDHRDGSYAYYISEQIGSYDLKGTGALIQAACEWERTL